MSLLIETLAGGLETFVMEHFNTRVGCLERWKTEILSDDEPEFTARMYVFVIARRQVWTMRHRLRFLAMNSGFLAEKLGEFPRVVMYA